MTKTTARLLWSILLAWTLVAAITVTYEDTLPFQLDAEVYQLFSGICIGIMVLLFAFYVWKRDNHLRVWAKIGVFVAVVAADIFLLRDYLNILGWGVISLLIMHVIVCVIGTIYFGIKVWRSVGGRPPSLPLP